MLLRYFTFVSFSFLLLLIACSPEQSGVVAEYGKYKINIDEFENAYAILDNLLEDNIFEKTAKLENNKHSLSDLIKLVFINF